jgi:hypothetical protein
MHAPLAVDGVDAVLEAAATRQRLDALDLFARLLIDGCVAEVDVPVQAGVGVILVFSGWVRGWCGKVLHVNSSDLLAAPPGD